MMTLGKLLHQSKDAIIVRWLEEALATYPGESAAAFRRQKDPFANPVGHSLRVGTRGIFEALLDGENAERIRRHLHEIIRIRAVQQFSASEAVGFVFQLKGAVRAELSEAVKDPENLSELTELDARIDRMALLAFDAFVQFREQVYELRVNESKRRVSWVVGKLNQRGVDPELARGDLE
jgi:hypothetical protein